MLKLSNYKKIKNFNSKKAVVDSILLWMVILVGFTSLFLLVTNYTHTLLIKKNVNELAEFASRSKGMGVSTESIVSSLNNMMLKNMINISAGDISCSDDAGVENKREVIFTVNIPNTSKLLPSVNLITSSSSSYNDENSVIETCSLTIVRQ